MPVSLPGACEVSFLRVTSLGWRSRSSRRRWRLCLLVQGEEEGRGKGWGRVKSGVRQGGERYGKGKGDRREPSSIGVGLVEQTGSGQASISL